jgi:hypothetical protein
MDTRQELEERLEMVLSDIMAEITSRKGSQFAGELDEAISFLKEAKDILKQLNDDDYVSDEEEDEDVVSVKKGRTANGDDLAWDDDYDDGY